MAIGMFCSSFYSTFNLYQTFNAKPKFKIKLNLHYFHAVTPKRTTRGEANLRGLAPVQHTSEETQTSQRWRADGDTVSD